MTAPTQALCERLRTDDCYCNGEGWCSRCRAASLIEQQAARITELERHYAEGLAAWKANSAHHAKVIDGLREELREARGL